MDDATLSHFDGEKWVKITQREWLKGVYGTVGFQTREQAESAKSALKEFGFVASNVDGSGKQHPIRGYLEFFRHG